jgi:hypothetical protein
MILLDTNIISEMMKSSPSSKVIEWLDGEDITQIFISTVTIAEISYGIQCLPNGKRQNYLIEAFDNVIQEGFKHRILFFHENAAQQYGQLMSHRKKIGKPLSILDGQIAAIAKSEKAALATRNIRDFVDCELILINPFH